MQKYLNVTNYFKIPKLKLISLFDDKLMVFILLL